MFFTFSTNVILSKRYFICPIKNSSLIYLHLFKSNRKQSKTPSARKSTYLDALLATVRSLGISLNVWRPKDSAKKLEWTSLLGREKRLLLRKLPCHFTKLLPPERAPVFQNAVDSD